MRLFDMGDYDLGCCHLIWFVNVLGCSYRGWCEREGEREAREMRDRREKTFFFFNNHLQ
jgi:hypothetical protein